jgi:hypothetical protein
MPVILRKPSGFEITGHRDDRVRDWLACSYLDDTWILRDSLGNGEDVTVTFRIVMPDGRLLIQHSKLYDTVKEFSYWIRAGDYSRIDDAVTHATYIKAIIRISMAVVNLGYTSFSDLQQADVDDICLASADGVGAVLNVPERLGTYLAQYATWDDVPAAEKIKRRSRNEHDVLVEMTQFNRDGVLHACNIPSTIARPATKREIVAATLRLNGHSVAVIKTTKQESQTATGILYITRSFEGLYRLRHHMEAKSLPFMPFEEGAGERAARLSRDTEPTPIVPSDLMMTMLDKTLTFLTERSEEIIRNHINAVAKLSGDDYDHVFAVQTRREATTLITACFIIIAAFTARRAHEINSIQTDCLNGNDKDGWMLRVYIEKSTRELAWIPIPRVVALAVNTVKRLSGEAKRDEDALLFRYLDPVLGREVGTWSEQKLNQFAALVGATNFTNHENMPDVWHWTTRQFRRFFAVLFFYRYKGKKESIAHHLRHYSMETTSGYLRLDPVVDRLWVEELRNFKKQVVIDIVSGVRNVTGPMGEVIKAEARRLRTIFNKVVEIYPERLADMVLERLDKNNVIFTPKAWATCSCPNTKSGARRAACQRASSKGIAGLGPNFSEAGPSICPACPWAILDEDNLAFMDEEIAELREANDNVEHPSIFAELQAEKLVVLRSHRAKQTAVPA